MSRQDIYWACRGQNHLGALAGRGEETERVRRLVSLAAPMQTPDSPQVCVAIPDPRSQDLGPEGLLEVWASREGSTCAVVLPDAVRCTGLSWHHLARVDR